MAVRTPPQSAKLLQHVACFCSADVGCRINVEQESLVHELIRGFRHRVHEPGVVAIELLE